MKIKNNIPFEDFISWIPPYLHFFNFLFFVFFTFFLFHFVVIFHFYHDVCYCCRYRIKELDQKIIYQTHKLQKIQFGINGTQLSQEDEISQIKHIQLKHWFQLILPIRKFESQTRMAPQAINPKSHACAPAEARSPFLCVKKLNLAYNSWSSIGT